MIQDKRHLNLNKYKQGRPEYFSLILKEKYNDLILNGLTELDFPALSREEIIDYINKYTFNGKSKYVSKYVNVHGTNNYDENINYLIIEFDKDYKENDIIFAKDIYSVNSYSEHYGSPIEPININDEYHYPLRENIIREQLGNQIFQFNKSLINEEFFNFTDYNFFENKYLFRTCSYDEIENLLTNGFLIGTDGYISLTTNAEHALRRLKQDNGIKYNYTNHVIDDNIHKIRMFYDYIVIYDKQILLDQNQNEGEYYEIPETYNEYLKLPYNIRRHIGKYFLNFEKRQQSYRNTYNRHKLEYPQANQNDILLSQLNSDEDEEDPEINEHEIVLKNLFFQHKLIHNILMIMPDNVNYKLYDKDYFKYYEGYKQLINLLIQITN